MLSFLKIRQPFSDIDGYRLNKMLVDWRWIGCNLALPGWRKPLKGCFYADDPCSLGNASEFGHAVEHNSDRRMSNVNNPDYIGTSSSPDTSPAAAWEKGRYPRCHLGSVNRTDGPMAIRHCGGGGTGRGLQQSTDTLVDHKDGHIYGNP